MIFYLVAKKWGKNTIKLDSGSSLVEKNWFVMGSFSEINPFYVYICCSFNEFLSRNESLDILELDYWKITNFDEGDRCSLQLKLFLWNKSYREKRGLKRWVLLVAPASISIDKYPYNTQTC